MNWRLAFLLALKSLAHHRTVTFATILGVALGMGVVGSVFIVDHNSNESVIKSTTLAEPHASRSGRARATKRPSVVPNVLHVAFDRQGDAPLAPWQAPVLLPTQQGLLSKGLSKAAPPPRRGEEDYQAMRLAVRLAAAMAFSMGALVVFYTMRYAVSSRRRELSLMLCLGERRRNVALSLALETGLLGAVGTLVGMLIAFLGASWLLAQGISTTGRVPNPEFVVPWWELGALGVLSMLVALAGVIHPIRVLLSMRVVEVLQPRFVAPGIEERELSVRGFSWLLPPLAGLGWLAMRPFLQDWLSVVQFFVVELLVVAGLALAAILWMEPLLRGVIRLAAWLLRPLAPFETLLAETRMRLTSRKLVFTIVGVILVFSLLTALHDISRSLRQEIEQWAENALEPYVFLRNRTWRQPNHDQIAKAADRLGLHVFRLSAKVRGEFPMRLIAASDVNPYRAEQGRPLLLPGTVLVSRTLAARFDVAVGDDVVIDTDTARHRFTIVDISDDVGFYADDGQYVDLKSYLLFSDGNPLFAENLETTLGRFLAVRSATGAMPPSRFSLSFLTGRYQIHRVGKDQANWQSSEIGRDLAIFDYILVMCVLLAGVGVANTLLLQVQARAREFAVLRSLGSSRWQTVRQLLIEGGIIGLVAALLALVLGNLVGAVSIAFLDRFTLFDYRFVFDLETTLLISALTVLTCAIAAIYPALAANRVSSAESLHYE